MGIAQSAAFIALQASIDPKDKAAASSGIFLSVTLGSVVGMAGTSAAIQGLLRHDIQQNLSDLGKSQHFIDDVSHSIAFVKSAKFLGHSKSCRECLLHRRSFRAYQKRADSRLYQRNRVWSRYVDVPLVRLD